ncbi:MAG: acyltransferase [Nitrospirae bacterium]|nr:acyltransferase [Nitrospirota bacterium]
MFYDIDYSLIEIGDNVTVTATAGFMTHDGSTRVLVGKHVPLIPSMIGKIVVHDNVFVGVRSLIMPGVTIGPNSIIAAGSVVTRSFDGGAVIGGIPARRIKSIEEYFSGIGQLPRLNRSVLEKKERLTEGVKYLEVLGDHPETEPFMEKLKNYCSGDGS